MKRLLFAPLILLAACGPKPPLEVRIPVPVRCVTPEQIPGSPPSPTIPDDARQAADILAAHALVLRAIERTMRALLTACTEAA